jgi:alpha-ribazole phosphatase
MRPLTIWLVRHALPEGHNGRCYGRHDIPLSADGIEQAEDIAKRLSVESISHVYSSGLSRALETARILAGPHNLAVQIIEELGEIHFGDCEGLTYEEVEQRFPEVFQSWMARPTETQFPNGENFGQMRSRVMGAFNALLLRHSEESVVIVTHAGVIRLLLGQALGIPENHIFRLGQRFGAINRVDYFDGSPVVQFMNG